MVPLITAKAVPIATVVVLVLLVPSITAPAVPLDTSGVFAVAVPNHIAIAIPVITAAAILTWKEDQCSTVRQPTQRTMASGNTR
jgi:hypothetical protein